ncbi:MAG: acylphosphatase, partial [Aquificaceae bacterium]
MRLRIKLRGLVQGVGFRPFLYRLAKELNLKGWVINSPSGVEMEVEGEEEVLERFLIRLYQEKPPLAQIYSQEREYLEEVCYRDFEIKESKEEGKREALILPDIATCNLCLEELFNPKDRRYRYPFINCVHCGPRFTIIERLPYDRPNTTMKVFEMCPQCKKEYEDPGDRRFHAQPIACPSCGPKLSLLDKEGEVIAEGEKALSKVLEALKDGKIVAAKGIGGFHLLCDATREEVVK